MRLMEFYDSRSFIDKKLMIVQTIKTSFLSPNKHVPIVISSLNLNHITNC